MYVKLQVKNGEGGGGNSYRYVGQSSFDIKARSKPLPVRLIRARFEPGISSRCSAGFEGSEPVGDGDFCDGFALAFSLRRFRVPIRCSVLCWGLVSVSRVLDSAVFCFDILGTEIDDGVNV